MSNINSQSYYFQIPTYILRLACVWTQRRFNH